MEYYEAIPDIPKMHEDIRFLKYSLIKTQALLLKITERVETLENEIKQTNNKTDNIIAVVGRG